MLRSSSKYTGDQVFPGTEGLAQTNSIYPFLDNLTAGGHASSSHRRKIRIISSFANTHTQTSISPTPWCSNRGFGKDTDIERKWTPWHGHGQLSCERPTLYRLVPLSITLFQHSRPKNQNNEGSRHHRH